jgi:hypothetical protein
MTGVLPRYQLHRPAITQRSDQRSRRDIVGKLPVRRENLAEADARSVLGEFGTLTSESSNVLVAMVADFSLARDYIERFSTTLRGGDALHLAIAANQGAKKILTLDPGLLDTRRHLDCRESCSSSSDQPQAGHKSAMSIPPVVSGEPASGTGSATHSRSNWLRPERLGLALRSLKREASDRGSVALPSSPPGSRMRRRIASARGNRVR